MFSILNLATAHIPLAKVSSAVDVYLFTRLFQAIHCSLHGVLREEKMTGPEVDDFFADLAADKICALQVVDW